MSSTAIVLRVLAERMQLETPHGRDIFGVLLFQDLAVVPLLILIPAIAEGSGDLAQRLAIALAKATLVLGVVLFLGQKLMRGWFHVVARRRSHELFILNVLLITLGLAWLTERAGLSLALGAFLAGMLIAETEYRHQVEEDIRPFREVLLGLFFVTMGMRLDLSTVGANLVLTLALTALLVSFKFVLVTGLARAFGSQPGAALRTGLAPRSGRRIQSRADRAGAIPCPSRPGPFAARRRGDAALDARCALPDSGERQARAAVVEHGVDAAIARAASRRDTKPRYGTPRDRVRLRPDGPAADPPARARED